MYQGLFFESSLVITWLAFLIDPDLVQGVEFTTLVYMVGEKGYLCIFVNHNTSQKSTKQGNMASLQD